MNRTKGLNFLYVAIAVCLSLACCKAKSSNAPTSFGLPKGVQQRIDVNDKNIGGGYFNIYIPSNYSEDRNWPVIFYYPGAGCKPSTEFFETATSRENFIIIAMEYVPLKDERMTAGQYVNYLKSELKSIAAVINHCSGTLKLKIDRSKMFISGISRGGWLVSNIISYRPSSFKAAVILCAGKQDLIPVSDATKMAGKPIYIGAGEKDPNLDAAKKASKYFAGFGADVTLEVYAGLGHSADPNTTVLKAFLLKNVSQDNSSKEDVKIN